MTDTGYIYKIICKLDSSFCYIGSTFNRLNKRFEGHRNDYKRKYGTISIHKYFDKYGIDNFKIILIKKYEVIRLHNKDHKHLNAYETLWINNSKGCCNTILPFNPLKKEKSKQSRKKYYDNNKEKSKQSKKKYYDNNKEKLKQSHKVYYDNNKEKHSERQKKYNNQPWFCDICNREYKLRYKLSHTKSKKHLSNIK
jgi:hypothetical protein